MGTMYAAVVEPPMSRARSRGALPRTALIAMVVGILAPAAFSGTAALFESTSTVGDQGFAAGTVYLSDNDQGRAALTMPNAAPGATETSYVEIAYGGTLPSSVRLYADVRGTGLDRFLTLTVTRGTGTGSGFAPDAVDYVGAGRGVLYAGTLADLPTSYANAVIDPDVWQGSQTRTFRMAVAVADDNDAQGRTADVDFHWEARNT